MGVDHSKVEMKNYATGKIDTIPLHEHLPLTLFAQNVGQVYEIFANGGVVPTFEDASTGMPSQGYKLVYKLRSSRVSSLSKQIQSTISQVTLSISGIGGGLLSEGTSQDGLHYQRQTVLRNAANPIGATLLLLQMITAWSYSGVKARPVRRLLPLLLGTMAIAVGLAAMSGLSSRIARGSEVLIDGSSCGRVELPYDNATLKLILGTPYNSRRIEQAADYAQRCYEADYVSSDCNSFLQKALPMMKTTNASCPFEDTLCLSQDSNIVIDSGLLDSHVHLGLNRPGDSRFQLQYKLQCAPLVTEGYRSEYSFENSTYIRYLYGDGSREPSDCNCSFAVNTDVTSLHTGSYSPFLEHTPEYSLLPASARFANGSMVKESSFFTPISELSQHNGDLQLIALIPGNVQFTTKSEDLWYRASTISNRSSRHPQNQGGTVRIDTFEADEPTWPLGCVQEYQICIDGNCSGLGSQADIEFFLRTISNSLPAFLGSRYYFSLWLSLQNLINALGRKALASRYQTSGGLQPGPKQNDWHLDVIHWYATCLSYIQFQLAELASGPSFGNNLALEEYVRTPAANESQQICHSQKIRSTNYTSFSMFWLLLVYILGTLVILISASVEPIMALLQKKFGSKASAYRGTEWRANSVLHLQRLAHAELGLGGWQRGLWDVPITKVQTNLAVLETVGPDDLPYLAKCKEESAQEVKSENEQGVLDAIALPDEEFQIHDYQLLCDDEDSGDERLLSNGGFHEEAEHE
ncbi:hypothetical protein HJFPF1_05791 [Paramyrothecium foliicola]|nr:hypothetical protein HJFPF1_05791 [Paramyrothecium foliicola]